jgi:hypothetical protein
MNKLSTNTIFFLALLSALTFYSTTTNAQCCPYMRSITVLPPNPTTKDSVKIITKVAPSTLGRKINSNYKLNKDSILLEACYYGGSSTAVEDISDTFNIGTLKQGTYFIKLKAQQSGNPNSCNTNKFTSMDTSFSVNLTAVNEPNNDAIVQIFPNPCQNTLSIKGENIQQINLYNLNNQLLKHEKGKETINIDLSTFPNGLYLLNITTNDGKKTWQKVIKE